MNKLLLGLATCTALTLLSPSGSADSIVTWGYNLFGEITNTPTENDFTQIVCGGRHTVALKPDGSIVSWGYDGFGQVAGTPAGTGFVQIAAGYDHSMALKADGSIVSWGSNAYGQVANTPAGTGFLQLSGGNLNSAAIRADGSIAIWGSNFYSLVSNVPAGLDFVQLSIDGKSHAMALRADGSIASWGEEMNGVLADTPPGTGFVQVSAGVNHSMALRTDGSIVTWGFMPSTPPSGTGFVQVDAGGSGNIALRSDGSIVAWGDDYYGQVTTAPTGTGFTQVRHGSGHLSILGGPLPGISYCTAGTSALGCTPLISASGEASASSGTGLTLLVPSAPGDKDGLFFFGTNGRQANSWGNGTSYQCVVPPVQRTPIITGNGSFNSCSGWFSVDLNAYWQTKPTHNPGAGAVVQAQLWYRDPQNTANLTTSLSDAIEVSVGP